MSMSCWVQKHKGRLSGSLEVSNRGTMDRMFSTPLANKERGITHRISKSRADFWKEEQNQPQDKQDNHTGLLPHALVRPLSSANYLPCAISAAGCAACHLPCLVTAALRKAERLHDWCCRCFASMKASHVAKEVACLPAHLHVFLSLFCC